MELFKATIIAYNGETKEKRFTFEQACEGKIQKWFSGEERDPRRTVVEILPISKLIHVFPSHVRNGDMMSKVLPELERINNVHFKE